MNKIFGLIVLTVIFWLPTFLVKYVMGNVADEIFLIVWLLTCYTITGVSFIKDK